MRQLRGMEEQVATGSVPAWVFGDEEIHRNELTRVFGSCWLFMAHEREVPNPGDYVRRPMGEDDFIVIRGDDGQVRVLFDACRHRGMALCRSDVGNTRRLRCPYHGWTYGNDGHFISAPAWRKAYQGLPTEALGLKSAPNVATYQGLVFASLDPAAPDLDTYLGDVRWYLDLLFGFDPDGIDLFGPPQRYTFEANWKTPAENFAGDDYHLATLHRSVWDVGSFPIPFEQDVDGVHVCLDGGHAVSVSTSGDPGQELADFGYFGLPIEHVRPIEAVSPLNHTQLATLRRTRVVVGNVFPNFSILAQPASAAVAGPAPSAAFTFRTWQPDGPGRVTMWNWFFCPSSLDEERKEEVRRAALANVCPGGAFEMDDIEPWGTIARTARSTASRLLDLDFNYQMGMPGIGTSAVAEHWPGPGRATSPRLDEHVQRHFLSHYLRVMSRDRVTG